MAKPRTWRRRIVTWFAILIVLYVAYCGLLYFTQTMLIFPASLAGQAGGGLPTEQAERLTLETDEGQTVAWFVPATGVSGSAGEAKPLAVFFHGNAELIDHQHGIIDLYHGMGASVLMVEYRGYGHSEGTPSQAHIVADTVAVLDGVLVRDNVDAERVILHGRSIGGGLAAQVALQREPRALIVESTGASIAAMAWRYGVPPSLVRSPLRTERAFAQLDMPILIMHGDRDQIFNIEQAHALNAAAADSTLVVFDEDHNTLPGASEAALYEASVRAVLQRAGVLD